MHCKTRILQLKICIRMRHRPLEFKPDQVSEHVLSLWLVKVQSSPQVIVLTWQWSLNSFLWSQKLSPWHYRSTSRIGQWCEIRQTAVLGSPGWGLSKVLTTNLYKNKGCLRTHEQGFGRRHKSNERETRMEELCSCFTWNLAPTG